MPGLRLFAFGAISEKGWGLGSEIELGNHIVGGLLVYLNPAPLGIRHQQTAIRCIEFHGRGLGEGPFWLRGLDLTAAFHVVRIGVHC